MLIVLSYEIFCVATIEGATHFSCVASATHFLFLRRKKMKTQNKILSLLLALILCLSMVCLSACDGSVNLEATSGQGEKGDQGEKGEQGEQGKSAYDIAVKNGFKGTEKEWLESLKSNDLTTGLKPLLDYYLLPDDTIGISISVDNYPSEIEIPSTYSGKIISKILPNGFENCYYLEKVIIQNGVADIGRSAFANCSYLESITIPNSVTSIGSNAFSACSNLTIVDFGGTMTEWRALGVTFLSTSCNIICRDGTLTYNGNSGYGEIIIPSN